MSPVHGRSGRAPEGSASIGWSRACFAGDDRRCWSLPLLASSSAILLVKAWPRPVAGASSREPAQRHDGRRHLGAAGRHVLPGPHFAGGRRADRHARRRLPERVRRRQLASRGSSTWRWSTWPACRASCTRCSASARSCCSPAWAGRCWRRRCTLAIMTLPVIITSTRGAGGVPMAFREACWNMGASRWQTIRTIVLPNSISGILTGVILQVSRAAGETAPILFTGAVFSWPCRRPGWRRSSVRPGRSGAWRCRITCSPSRRRCRACPTAHPVRAPRWCSSGWCWRSTRCRSPPRLPAVAEEMVADPWSPHIASRASDGALRPHQAALDDVTLEIPRNRSSAIIGPANSGKTTLLKCINRTIDFASGRARSTGEVTIDGEDVLQSAATCTSCAAASAWCFRCRSACRCRSTTTWPTRRGWPVCADRAELDALVEACLRQAALWDEVKDRLHLLGTRALGRPAAAADAGPGAVAPARDPVPRRVLDRHRPGDDDEDRGRAGRAEAAR